MLKSPIERVAGGVIDPFETSFEPILADIKGCKEELEHRAAVAGHECKLGIAIFRDLASSRSAA